MVFLLQKAKKDYLHGAARFLARRKKEQKAVGNNDHPSFFSPCLLKIARKMFLASF
jgi:hypothetical protein